MRKDLSLIGSCAAAVMGKRSALTDRVSEFRLKDKPKCTMLSARRSRSWAANDTPFSYGVVSDETGGGQILYFDLPRVSPLQFNPGRRVSTSGGRWSRKSRRSFAARVRAD